MHDGCRCAGAKVARRSRIDTRSASMAAVPEVLVEFDENIASDAGVLYHARALGVTTAPSHWEGWLEFTPLSDGGVSVDTDRETTQPNRTDLLYWVTGLTRVYL